MKYPIPNEGLDDRLGWVGNSGSGKTHDAGTAIERVLKHGSRACIIDPLGVWWGLRLNADGKAPGFKVAIFGGPHGDIAITETSGKLIGETVASTKESCIIDLSEFESDASQRRFMLAFLVALYNGLRGDLLHLVLDEADMWAPQRILDKEGEATKLHHNVQKIVRRGRVKGFISWLITQRPAEISKSILSMMDGMVLHQALSPQDINACMDWVRPRADKTTAEMIETEMPTFEVGKAVVYIPRRRILNVAQFPRKATFDSSAAPKRGEKKNRPDVVLKPLDIDALKEKLEKVEAEAKANDPSALKGEIAKLKAEKAALERANATAKPAAPDKATVKAELTARMAKAIERAATSAKIEGYGEAMKAISEMISTGLKDTIGPFADLLNKMQADFAKIEKWATREQRKPTAMAPVTRDDAEKAFQQSGSPSGYGVAAPSPARAPAPVRSVAPARMSSPASASGDDDRPLRAERKPLAALAAVAPAGMTEAQWAVAAGLKRSGGTWGTYLSRLRMAGRIVQQGDAFFATEQGIADLGGEVPSLPPPGPQLVEFWASKITGASKMLRYLAEQYPAFVTRDEIGAALNLATSGGTFGTYLSRLRGPGLLEEQGDQVRAAPQLMEAA